MNLYDAATGKLQRSIGATSSGPAFKRPVGVAVASNGDVYVADTMNHRIVVLAEALPTPAVEAGRSEPTRP